eukprot:Em0025g84a
MLDLLARAGVSSPIAVLTGVLDRIRSQFLPGAKMLQVSYKTKDVLLKNVPLECTNTWLGLASSVDTCRGNACYLMSCWAPPSTPNITSLISTYSDQLTVTWTSVPTATSYNVNINDSANTKSSTGAQQYTFTGLTNNTVYTVSVVAINNCAESSSPATISNRTSNGPTAPPPVTSATVPKTDPLHMALRIGVSVMKLHSGLVGVVVANGSGYTLHHGKLWIAKPRLLIYRTTAPSTVDAQLLSQKWPSTVLGTVVLQPAITDNGPAVSTSLPPKTTPTPLGPSILAAGPCTAAVGSSIGTAVGVSVLCHLCGVFSMGVLVASVLCYISRRINKWSEGATNNVIGTLFLMFMEAVVLVVVLSLRHSNLVGVVLPMVVETHCIMESCGVQSHDCWLAGQKPPRGTFFTVQFHSLHMG